LTLLIAAVVLFGAFCILDLLLTIGLAKRLREQSRRLDDFGRPPTRVAVGTVVGAFDTATVDGVPVRSADLADGTVVAFLSPTCGPCQDKLPALVEYGAQTGPGRPLVAVVTGDDADADEFVRRLGPVARVVREEPDGGAFGAAFGVSAYPIILRVGRDDEGRLTVVDNDVVVGRPVGASV
jgi:thiol-disulfide isomerase/thioredoxin